MKRVLLLCFFLYSAFLFSFAQNHVTYSYDATGNRTGRTWTRGGAYMEQSPDSLLPVMVPASSTDTINVKPVTRKDEINLSIKRPEIQGYHMRLNEQTDLYHSFPRMLDDIIVKNGEMVIQQDGSYLFKANGYVNGVRGVYEICINERGVVYHHYFNIK